MGVDPDQFQRGDSKRVRFNLSRNLFVCYLVAIVDRRERLGQKPYWITLIRIIQGPREGVKPLLLLVCLYVGSHSGYKRLLEL